MSKTAHTIFLLGWIAVITLIVDDDVHAQTGDTTKIINFPLPYEDFSLYDFAEIRFETDKTETPPAGLIKRSFKPIKNVFETDSLYFVDSIESVWFKFSIRNNYPADTTVALIFLGSVNKAVLYKKESEKIILVGKTGWGIAVLARAVPDEWSRINIVLKAHSTTTFFLQNPRVNFRFMLNKTPVLESFAYAEMMAYHWEKEVNRPGFLWYYFFYRHLLYVFCVWLYQIPDARKR